MVPTVPQGDDPDAAVVADAFAGSEVVLEAENLVRRFGEGQTKVIAVRGVSLSVRAGEIVLIMGPSGSGKTTLLLMLGALLHPSEGRISVRGEEISALPEKRLFETRLRHFGFVFQDFNLLSALSARENVEVVLNLAGVKGNEARRRAEAVLRELDMGDRLEFHPAQLSGGEKQRVALARALANDPAIVLADEPTANLDSRIGREVMGRLQRIAREEKRSIIVVTHDERVKEIADRVLWLEDGEFKASSIRALDPVCGMSVDAETAPRAHYHGRTYYFCAEGCRSQFLEDPDRYMSSADR